jgi:hypothetical protein
MTWLTQLQGFTSMMKDKDHIFGMLGIISMVLKAGVLYCGLQVARACKLVAFKQINMLFKHKNL